MKSTQLMMVAAILGIEAVHNSPIAAQQPTPSGVTATQQPAPTGVTTGCTYATCALRVESSFLRGTRLVRGASGEPLKHLGGFGEGVQPLLNGPDSAAAYSRQYVAAQRRKGVLGLIGLAAYTTVVVRAHNRPGPGWDPTTANIAAAGTGFLIASIPFDLRARRSLSRAVWWYNEALPR